MAARDLCGHQKSLQSYRLPIGENFESPILTSPLDHAALPALECNVTGAFFLLLLGITSIASGCLLLILQPYDILFKMKLKFSDGAETYEMWRKPAVELYLRVHLFNVTNKDKFLSGEEDLMVQEVGPYVYRENMEHKNVTFNDNGTLTMAPYHLLTWVPELSVNRSEDDILVLPNIALLSIANVVKDSSYFTRMGLNILIKQTDSQPLVSMTAKEFMFGYRSSLVTLGNSFMPSWIYFEKLGLIDRMYDFTDDVATVFTGETDIRLSGITEKYNRDVALPQWEGKCALINGTSDSTKFPSLIDANDTLIFFRKSVCRPMPLVRDGELTNKNGLMTYRYKFAPNSLDNGVHNPENKCFCRKGRCLKEGLIDVTECYYGFPIAVSYPHFYQGDPSLISEVKGSSPDPEKHETYFYIEPRSGIPVDLAVRFQINMALDDVSPIARVGRFKNMVLPMLWTEIGMRELPGWMNNKFILYLNVAPVVQDVLVYLSFCAGAVFLFVSVARVMRSCWRAGGFDFFREEEFNRKHANYMVASDNKNSIKGREMDVFYDSLVPCASDDERVNLFNGADKMAAELKSDDSEKCVLNEIIV
ncbi:scavenger receptor class B member 1-like isoform X2 [Bacillus rossius redtenbacheri]|uniref:scavenger receptor class B member 1-like isoform X2 n=1 Tax=Bacillus rossius redtenbacheri TaxID=93214 RepID=UPI002FDE0301